MGAPAAADANDDLVEEDVEEMLLTAEQGRKAKAARDAWDRLVEQSADVTVQNLTLVEIVADRSVPRALHALARMHARLRSQGLRAHRLHGDASLGGGQADSLTHTSTRSKVATENRVLKRMVRILMRSQDCGEDAQRLWPALARHSGERDCGLS